MSVSNVNQSLTNSNTQGAFRFLDLPSNITQLIGKYLRNVEDLIACFKVTKQFHRRVILMDNSNVFDFTIINNKFRFVSNTGVTFDGSKRLFPWLAKNQYPLSIEVFGSIRVHKHLKMIETLNPNLIKLRCQAEANTMKVFSNCSENLRYLNLTGSGYLSAIEEELINGFFVQSANNLEEINFGECAYAENVKQYVPNWKNILKLSLKYVSDEELKAIICPNLLDIRLGYGSCTADGLKELGGNCPNIRTIIFTNMAIGQKVLEAISLYFPNLERFEAYDRLCPIDDETFKSILRNCRYLKSLTLVSSSLLTEKGLKGLFRYGQNLEQLEFGYYKEMTEEELKDDAVTLPNLRRLALDCKTFEPRLLLKFPNLRSFSLLTANILDEDKIKAIPNDIQELEILSDIVTDKVLEILLGFKNLKRLVIRSKEITAQAKAAFEQKHPNSANLTVR